MLYGRAPHEYRLFVCSYMYRPRQSILVEDQQLNVLDTLFVHIHRHLFQCKHTGFKTLQVAPPPVLLLLEHKQLQQVQRSSFFFVV